MPSATTQTIVINNTSGGPYRFQCRVGVVSDQVPTIDQTVPVETTTIDLPFGVTFSQVMNSPEVLAEYAGGNLHYSLSPGTPVRGGILYVDNTTLQAKIKRSDGGTTTLLPVTPFVVTGGESTALPLGLTPDVLTDAASTIGAAGGAVSVTVSLGLVGGVGDGQATVIVQIDAVEVDYKTVDVAAGKQVNVTMTGQLGSLAAGSHTVAVSVDVAGSAMSVAAGPNKGCVINGLAIG